MLEVEMLTVSQPNSPEIVWSGCVKVATEWINVCMLKQQPEFYSSFYDWMFFKNEGITIL